MRVMTPQRPALPRDNCPCRRRGCGAGVRDRDRGTDQGLCRHPAHAREAGARRCRPGGAARLVLRAARAQRRGQVDADQHHGGARGQDRGQVQMFGDRHRRASRAARGAPSASCRRSSTSTPSSRPRETLEVQAGLYGVPGRAAHRRDPGRGRPGRQGRRLCAHAVGRHAPAAAGRQGAGPPPPVVVLDEPTAGVDVELRRSLWAYMRELNAQRHDHPAHHALPRGSRGAVRPDRDHRPRPRGRLRHQRALLRRLDEKELITAATGRSPRCRPRWRDAGADLDGEGRIVFRYRPTMQVERLLDAVRAAEVTHRRPRHPRGRPRGPVRAPHRASAGTRRRRRLTKPPFDLASGAVYAARTRP